MTYQNDEKHLTNLTEVFEGGHAAVGGAQII